MPRLTWPDSTNSVSEVPGALQTVANAFRRLDEAVPEPEVRRHLKRRLIDSNSMQDRYTLLLYALLRSRGARDLSYRNIQGEQCAGRAAGMERLLDEQAEPERQHLVPYSTLQRLYRIDQRGRISRHIAHNIGNMTWISSALNTFDGGLGSLLVKIAFEGDENRGAHLLDDVEGAPSAFDAVASAVRSWETDTTDDRRTKRLAKRFEEFSKRRRERIADGFMEWLQALSGQGYKGPRIEPELRFEPSHEDQIRQLGYGDELEDALVALLCHSGLSVWGWKWKSGTPLRCRVRRNSKEAGLALTLSSTGIEATGAGVPLLDVFRECAPAGGILRGAGDSVVLDAAGDDVAAAIDCFRGRVRSSA